MRTLRFLLQKEFRQIFRDSAIVRLIFILPLAQLTILPLAADFEVKNINLAIVDHDHSTYTRRLVSQLSQSSYFNLITYTERQATAMQLLDKDEIDLYMEFPAGFERTLVRENGAKVFLGVNAINGVKGNLGAAYASQVLQGFNQTIRAEWLPEAQGAMQGGMDLSYRHWFNPSMNYQRFMVPGILAILLTMVGAFLTALNIVREKEMGTIEQLNVTPIRKHHFILGKLIPFWILGLVVLSLGLGIAYVIYGIIPLGSFATLYLFSAVYLLAVLGFGLLISTLADTQQQAMFIAFFFMLIFILMSGLFTSVESMPTWAEMIARASPVTYFVEVMRMIVLKGATFSDISESFWIICGFTVLFNTLAVLNYSKRA